jgi:Aconitase A
MNGLDGISKLPECFNVLLENLLRYEVVLTVEKKQIFAIKEWFKYKKSYTEIAYIPARSLLQDYTGIPAIAGLAAMRDAVKDKNKNPDKINPLSTVDLVIDHSVMVDEYASGVSFGRKVAWAFSGLGGWCSFFWWGLFAFVCFSVVPPGPGVCLPVSFVFLSVVVWSSFCALVLCACPGPFVGSVCLSALVCGVSVLGWGVGGFVSVAAMLVQPIPKGLQK